MSGLALTLMIDKKKYNIQHINIVVCINNIQMKIIMFHDIIYKSLLSTSDSDSVSV